MKVYVTQCGEYSDYHYSDIFLSEEKAKQFCEVQNKLDRFGEEWWYCEEETADNKFNNTVDDVKNFYYCRINLNTGEIEEYGEEDQETTLLINKKESFYEIEKPRGFSRGLIEAYSTKSYEHAKKIAIEQYQIYTQNKLESEQ